MPTDGSAFTTIATTPCVQSLPAFAYSAFALIASLYADTHSSEGNSSSVIGLLVYSEAPPLDNAEAFGEDRSWRMADAKKASSVGRTLAGSSSRSRVVGQGGSTVHDRGDKRL